MLLGSPSRLRRTRGDLGVPCSRALDTASSQRLMNGGNQIDSSDTVVCHKFAAATASQLEARLVAAESARQAAEAAREVAEARAVRAEADARRLRQQLTVFGEKLISAANSGAIGPTAMPSAAAPTSNDAAHTAMSRPGAHPRSDAGSVLPEKSGSRGSDGAATPTPSNNNEQPQPKRSRRVWMFNPKWKTGRDWLEYDVSNETMGCSVCRIAGESGKWARNGITRMRLEAITSHANDIKHQKHMANAEAAKRHEAQQRSGTHGPPSIAYSVSAETTLSGQPQQRDE